MGILPLVTSYDTGCFQSTRRGREVSATEGCHRLSCSAMATLPCWSKHSETERAQINLSPLSGFCLAFCHSNRKERHSWSWAICCDVPISPHHPLLWDSSVSLVFTYAGVGANTLAHGFSMAPVDNPTKRANELLSPKAAAWDGC